ncbi:MAG: imelysin [Campylobacterales bacterium]|nr:imelysin [Campylobacterales bacterium]
MKPSKHLLGALSLSAALVLGMSACNGGGGGDTSSSSLSSATSSASSSSATVVSEADKKAFLRGYAHVALLSYEDALLGAKALQSALAAFTANPTEVTLASAKAAWIEAREAYSPSEIFRLSGGPIDAEEGWVAEAYGALEGQINAWPLDEAMIDYTLDADGARTAGNIIDTAGSFTPSGGEAVDVSAISVDALSALNENGGEANVATGYHAIEFLLWGQDQDYDNFVADTITHGQTTAGQRPLSDYTTDANAQRRKAYLNAAAAKLVDDLERVAGAWRTTREGNTGRYRAAFLGELTGAEASDNIATDAALKAIFGGMGVFLKSELANERIAVAVLTPSEEDEHSCFSDNTHRDILLNFQGFTNVMRNQYPAGTALQSAKPMGELVKAFTQAQLSDLVAQITAHVNAIDATAKSSQHFDYQVRPTEFSLDSGVARQNIIDAKNKMRQLGDMMVSVAADFGISLSEEDVTDAEETVVE